MRKHLKKNEVHLTLTLAALFLLIGGCSKKEGGVPSPPSPPPVQKPVQKPASSSAKAAVQRQQSSSRPPAPPVIDFTNRRDPFKPLIAMTSEPSKEQARRIDDRNLLPIQRYEVERFRVTGIITGLKENRAMIMDPDGKGYVARVGMKIGPNDGRIVRITPQGIEVDENFRDDFGRMKKRTVKLALQRKR